MMSRKPLVLALAIAIAGLSSCETPTGRTLEQVPTGVVVGSANASSMPVPFEPCGKPTRWAKVTNAGCIELPQDALIGLSKNAKPPEGTVEVRSAPSTYMSRTDGDSTWPMNAIVGWSGGQMPSDWAEATAMPPTWAESR